MAALICGSMAFDTIMVFDGHFKDHILPDKIHMLNVSFGVPDLRREFGGCAGNIAYNLKCLGGAPLPMATVGHDFGVYAEWLERHQIPAEYLREMPDAYTAQAYITTDLDDNQITAFHPGAMMYSHKNAVPNDSRVKIGIVAPDGRDGMLQHCEQFAAANIPFIFDPGQGMPLFNGDDLKTMVEQATWVALNSYEAELMQDRTGLSMKDLAERVEAVVVTHGAKGSVVYTDGQQIEIPAVKAAQVEDPTGCGDAYRAGLLYGLEQGYDWATIGRMAALLGAMKVESHGTQNHVFTPESFAERFEEAFGYRY